MLAAPPDVSRWLARAGFRTALAQAVVVVFSFLLAGVVTQAVTDRLQNAATRERVLGEVRSLEDEVRQKGVDHLSHTVGKRSHLWRGFAYRMDSLSGALLAGDLSAQPAEGWRRQPGKPDAVLGSRPYLVFTERLPGGAKLSVGQDLSAEVKAAGALADTLFLCGALGVVVCIVASHAFSRCAWRRVAAVAAVAREVRAGRLGTRAVVRNGPPRDDLDDLAHSFNGMLDRIELLMGQVRQVSVDIAHDLRTPLTRVRQRIDRLENQARSDPSMQAGLRRVDEDLVELLRTFDALLQLAEIEVDPAEAPVRSFDLAEVATRVAEAFRPDIEEGGRVLSVRTAPVLVRGDDRLMAQLVANLLENAARHTPVGCRIAVTVGAAGGARLLVEDDGPGVPAGQLETVLRPLVRLETSRHQPGSGLGLSIVAAIARRHGAVLTLEDARPGLRVRLKIPADFDGRRALPAPEPPPSEGPRVLAEVS